MPARRILIVNDAAPIAHALRDEIEGFGLTDVEEIEVVADGAAALAALADRPYDLVVSDVYMPHVDGWKLCRHLHAPGYVGAGPRPPVILVSATFRDATAAQLSAEVGAVGFLHIPYERAELEHLVRTHLAPAARAAAAAAPERAVAPPRSRILVAHPDDAVRAAAAAALAPLDAEVGAATDVADLDAALAAGGYDLLVVGEPWLAPDAARLGRALLARGAPLVVVLAGAPPAFDPVHLLVTGAEAVLDPPTTERALAAVAGQALRKLNLLRVNAQFRDQLDRARASEEMYRALFESSLDPVLIATPAEVRIVGVNRAFEMLTGLRRREVVGRRLAVVAHAGRPTFESEMAALGATGREVHLEEIALVRSDGRPIPVDLTGGVVAAGGQRLLQLFVRDLSQDVRRERRLVEAERRAVLGQLVASVAHEVADPLTAVLGCAQQLARRAAELPAGLEEHANRLDHESARVHAIVERLLRFVAPPAQGGDAGPVDVAAAVEDALGLHQQALAVSDVVVVREIGAGPLETRGSAQRLTQALLSIVDHCHEAMVRAHRGGTLTVRARRAGAEVEVELSDDGPGLSDPPRVFDPAWALASGEAGGGLGLAVADQIVRDHGGTLRASNLVGGGARFVVRLPTVTAAARGAGTAPGTEGAAAAGDAPARLLVVDDEETVGSLVGEILSEAGHEVTVARSGEEAMARLREGSYDLILADLRMPGPLAGEDLYHWIADHRQGEERRVMFLTGDTTRAETRAFLERNANPRLVKPFAPQALRQAVSTALAVARGG